MSVLCALMSVLAISEITVGRALGGILVVVVAAAAAVWGASDGRRQPRLGRVLGWWGAVTALVAATNLAVMFVATRGVEDRFEAFLSGPGVILLLLVVLLILVMFGTLVFLPALVGAAIGNTMAARARRQAAPFPGAAAPYPGTPGHRPPGPYHQPPHGPAGRG